jgi:O-antigen/teichoic acid export membrane protein
MMLASSWFELTARIQIARLHPGRYLRMNIGRALFVLAGATGAAWLTRDPVLTGLGMAAGLVAGVALAGGEQPFPRLNLFDRVTARSIIIFGLPMAVSMAMSGLTNSGTRALVEGLDSTAALGVFTAAYMIVQNTLAAIAAGVASAAYPLAVRAVDGGDPVVARRQLLANGEMLLTIVAPIAVGMALTADGIAEILVGPHFQSGLAELTPWMAAGTFFAVIRANYLDHAFQLGKRPHLQIRVTAFAAVWAIGLCVWLVPHQGPTGAAIAITVAMAFSCVHAWFAGKRAYPLPFPSVAFAKVGTACAVMAAMVLAVPGHGTGVFVTKVGLGGAGYAAIAVATDLLGLRRTLLDRWARGPNAERIRDALTSRGRAR